MNTEYAFASEDPYFRIVRIPKTGRYYAERRFDRQAVAGFVGAILGVYRTVDEEWISVGPESAGTWPYGGSKLYDPNDLKSVRAYVKDMMVGLGYMKDDSTIPEVIEVI